MCGITITIANGHQPEKLDHSRVKRRGPDGFNQTAVDLGQVQLEICAAVLHMRGVFSGQPIADNDGNITAFNGEIFNEGLVTNDSVWFHEQLQYNCDCSNKLKSFLNQIKGPWAFAHLDLKTKKLWFGRDVFGRRSLLIGCLVDTLVISSVAETAADGTRINFTELPAGILFELNLDSSPFVITSHPLVIPSSFTQASLAQMRLNPLVQLNEEMQIDDASDQLQLFQLNRTATEIPEVKDVGVEDILQRLSVPYGPVVNEFLSNLRVAVERRIVGTLPSACKNCPIGTACSHAKLAVLFSGGVDSAILAALADEFVPADEPIDLLNVSFHSENSTDNQVVPDRLTGLSVVAELRLKSPSRVWNFVEINVSMAEVREIRHSTISKLVSPAETVLDDSIGCCLWFAARGKGVVMRSDGIQCEYETSAAAVLIGTGADELLAGYSRHRGIYERFGLERVLDELAMELARLPYRNLGRDDRVIGDSGRESRLPFLDENFVVWLNSIPADWKFQLSLPRGLGEKLLLRLALYRLGLVQTATNLKRAMQFGSRIAKLENSAEKANDVCHRLISSRLE